MVETITLETIIPTVQSEAFQEQEVAMQLFQGAVKQACAGAGFSDTGAVWPTKLNNQQRRKGKRA